MISVEAALEKVLALCAPLGVETVALPEAAGRVLAEPARARITQPPFDASAMDGYAIAADDLRPGARLRVVGESRAGHAFAGHVGAGEAVRIFTGAAVPEGAGTVAIQEDTTRSGDHVILSDSAGGGPHIRRAGDDFNEGDSFPAPRVLRPADLALLAAMNIPELRVTRRPIVAVIATGDELVMPGETPHSDQIIASNTFALKAMAEAEGAEARLMPIARDSEASLRTVLELAADADLIVTVGGASVGDHDLVGPVAEAMGMERAFYKVAMRPGKPLMAGRLGGSVMLGLPGNPVSAVVCGQLFMLPALRAMLGLPAPAPRLRRARLACAVEANGPRAHYMRARLEPGAGDLAAIAPFERQDSALLSVLGTADALLLRPPEDPARPAGHEVLYLPLHGVDT
ncbi:molybdopterin molybdenumtransferase MoeA [Rhodobacteraceae bacterium WD3A24]|nr:molybdopterin molybdenumtransferase MoeA [Rhodobacteraceae bacterium WD3A24]